ncbi:PREDICTED: uncharacterized protein LOC105456181 [Wasmannia auropunctata]|uniref:uncharacterized protein LOC105456181 n=1 Tax=Wasmannia auropunctata TaxID=64793 RepID=UPI0005EF9DFA|nr:PREDICTED: uncharacterized protein LOC105456181 [Wasmannia auropunctata]
MSPIAYRIIRGRKMVEKDVSLDVSFDFPPRGRAYFIKNLSRVEAYNVNTPLYAKYAGRETRDILRSCRVKSGADVSLRSYRNVLEETEFRRTVLTCSLVCTR